MLNAQDQEKVAKSSQAANLLAQDLRELVSADDPLLGDVALDLLRQAAEIENRLKRIESITRAGKNPG